MSYRPTESFIPKQKGYCWQLTLAYGEYTLKKSSVFKWHRQLKEGHEDVLAIQDHACVFLQSQGDSALRINCTRTNSESTVIFETADKDTGICSCEKTQTLAG
jgi:hypothetical protein